MKMKLLPIILGCFGLLSLCSCFNVKSTITLKADGSGTLVEEVLFGEQVKAMLAMAPPNQSGEDPFAQMLNKEKLAKRAASMGEGVSVASVEKIDTDGQLGARVTFHFNDINTLRYSQEVNMDGSSEKPASQKSFLLFSLKDNKLTITQQDPKVKAANLLTPEQNDAALEAKSAQIMGLMGDMTLLSQMVIEPGISKTNASYVEGNTIIFTDLAMAKVLKDKKASKVMVSGDPKATREALSKVEGIKMETKETITVEF